MIIKEIEASTNMVWFRDNFGTLQFLTNEDIDRLHRASRSQPLRTWIRETHPTKSITTQLVTNPDVAS